MSWWNVDPMCFLFHWLVRLSKCTTKEWRCDVDELKDESRLSLFVLFYSHLMHSKRLCFHCWCLLYGLFPVIFTNFHSLKLTDCLSSCSSCVSSTREQVGISTVERYAFSVPYRRITASISSSLPGSSQVALPDEHAIPVQKYIYIYHNINDCLALQTSW